MSSIPCRSGFALFIYMVLSAQKGQKTSGRKPDMNGSFHALWLRNAIIAYYGEHNNSLFKSADLKCQNWINCSHTLILYWLSEDKILNRKPSNLFSKAKYPKLAQNCTLFFEKYHENYSAPLCLRWLHEKLPDSILPNAIIPKLPLYSMPFNLFVQPKGWVVPKMFPLEILDLQTISLTEEKNNCFR